MNNRLISLASFKTMNLLSERRALLYPEGTVFWVWPREDRLVIVFDTDEINMERVNDEFAHLLSSRLEGRPVVRTNSRGLFLQIGYEIPPALMDLSERPLDLVAQPTPFHLPLGVTGRGDMWLDLREADSVLLGGARGMGKTGILHGWVQALLHGGQVQVAAWDGKDGSEFGRYADRANFHLLTDLQGSLRSLLAESARRRDLLMRSGHPNVVAYNSDTSRPAMPLISLVIDEAALVPESARAMLAEYVERCRDTGMFPILATNNPQQARVIVKSNLRTRISLAVPSLAASVMVLGLSGAERLPKQRGRGLMELAARMVEFQAFGVDYPAPSAAAVERVVSGQSTYPPTPFLKEGGVGQGEIVELAERIRSQWSPSLSKRKTAELLGKTYAGSWAEKVDRVIGHLSATTTAPEPVFTRDSGLIPA